jgi:hypothetical protein
MVLFVYIVPVFRPGCSQQNAQWIWSYPFTEIRIVGCISLEVNTAVRGFG